MVMPFSRHQFARALCEGTIKAPVNFSPAPENTLMPLSSNGLCDAEITTPAVYPIRGVRYATAGVGMTPGSAFADNDMWDRYVRICIAREDNVLEGALEKLRLVLR